MLAGALILLSFDLMVGTNFFNPAGGGEPVVPLADFADAYEVQRVLSAVVESDKQRSPVPLDQIQQTLTLYLLP